MYYERKYIQDNEELLEKSYGIAMDLIESYPDEFSNGDMPQLQWSIYDDLVDEILENNLQEWLRSENINKYDKTIMG